ncbi:MAG: hypothetical protein FJW79_09980 [Actinobacteria bacterium]|nr:hypothetical protein [Actinomycetota bacterium]
MGRWASTTPRPGDPPGRRRQPGPLGWALKEAARRGRHRPRAPRRPPRPRPGGCGPPHRPARLRRPGRGRRPLAPLRLRPGGRLSARLPGRRASRTG